MAVPFNIPDEPEDSSSENVQNPSSTSSNSNSTTRPIPIPIRIDNSQSASPQHSPVDNEMLVQAFYEALCRCSQELPNFQISVPSSPANSLNHGNFWYPTPAENFYSSPSTSAFSSPRNSFRINQTSRIRLNSYGNHSQYSHFSEDSGVGIENDLTNCEHIDQIVEEVLEEVPQPKAKSSNNKKKPKDANKSSKITNLVISALQFVIDTLK